MQHFQRIPGITGLMFPDYTPNPTRRFHAHHPSSSSSPSPPIKCPRCDSTNTKFCYYNNYNLSQPRHFCKSCRRYWTKGGVLRNVPVGGGCRKNSSSKRSKPKSDKNPNPPTTSAPASGSGSSSESSSNPIHNHNQEPLIEHPVFSQADFGFGFSDPGSGLLTEEQKVEEIGGELEWGAAVGSDSGTLFDMTSSVDPAVYWNQSHWGDNDPSLYLP